MNDRKVIDHQFFLTHIKSWQGFSNKMAQYARNLDNTKEVPSLHPSVSAALNDLVPALNTAVRDYVQVLSTACDATGKVAELLAVTARDWGVTEEEAIEATQGWED